MSLCIMGINRRQVTMPRTPAAVAAENELARLSEESLRDLQDAFTPLSIGGGGGEPARLRAALTQPHCSPESDEAHTPGECRSGFLTMMRMPQLGPPSS